MTEYNKDLSPLDFLFCRTCSEHKYSWYFQYVSLEQTNEGTKLGARPKCNDCDSFLIQKYVTVKVNIEV